MTYQILIDGTKLLDPETDGIKRYVLELLRAMSLHAGPEWNIDVALAPAHTMPLNLIEDMLDYRQPLHVSGLPSLLSPYQDNPLLACKARLEERQDWGIVSASSDITKLQAMRFARSCLRRWFELKEITRRGKEKQYDLFHLTLPNTWKKFARRRTQFVTTVHDLSHFVCPQFQNRSNVESLQQGLDFTQSIRSKYLSVSHSTAKQLEQLMHIDPAHIHVVYEGVDLERFSAKPAAAAVQEVRDRYGLPTTPFLFSLGTMEPRKNLLNTVRAFAQLVKDPDLRDAQLVIAGRQGWGKQKELEQIVNSCPQIRTIGYVEEVDLPTLYAACDGFCYLSHYEGFGLPIAEAMSCGAAVIYGDNSSQPEVAGDGGIGVNSHDVPAIATAMRSLLTDPKLRTDLSRRAVRRAHELTWHSTAEKTLQVYRHCLTQTIENLSVNVESLVAKAA